MTTAPADVATVTRKDPVALPVTPNLVDYARTYADFTWDDARGFLDGLPGGRGLNIAHECVDRHAAGPLAGRVAFRFVDRAGARWDMTYAELRDATNRFANVLARWGSHQVTTCSFSSAGCRTCMSVYSARSSSGPWRARCSRPSAPSRCASGSRSGPAGCSSRRPPCTGGRSRRCGRRSPSCGTS